MAKNNNKINMPNTGGGLTRYFDDYKSSIEFQPGTVIVMAVVVMALVLLLHLYGPRIFG